MPNIVEFYSPFGLLWLAIESLYSVLVMKIPDWEVMMSKVLKTLLASLILFSPAFALATTSSYASLSNFSYEVTGPGVSATPGTFLAVSSGTVNGASTAASTNVLGADFRSSCRHTLLPMAPITPAAAQNTRRVM